MAFYSGSVQAKDIFTTILGHITAVQPGESTSWWKKESSLDSDGAYTSTGSTGTDRIVIQLKDGVLGQNITVGSARDYTPGAINTAGAYDILMSSVMSFYTGPQGGTAIVSYDLSVTKDRVIIHLQGDKLITGWLNPVVYLGMPIRYDLTDKKCIVKAISENSPVVGFLQIVQNATGATTSSYPWQYAAAPSSPSWGNTYFLETLHFGVSGEGFRGEIDGLFGLHSSGVVDSDEIQIAGQAYKVIVRNAQGNNGFPRDAFAMKKS